MLRSFLLNLILLTAATQLVSSAFGQDHPREKDGFNRELWLKDYEILKQHIATTYANFESKVEAKTVDPYLLNQQTTSALAQAVSDKEALAALLKFIGAFQDPHFRITNLSGMAEIYLPMKATFPIQLHIINNITKVKSINAKDCSLKPGDVIESVNGKAIDDLIKPYLYMYPTGNDALRRSYALNAVFSGSFALESPATIQGIAGTQRVSCIIEPIYEKRTTTPTAAEKPPATDVPELHSSTDPETACKIMGFQDPRPSSAMPHHDLEGYTTVKSSNAFERGILKLKNGEHVAFMRVGSFSEFGYPGVCRESWKKFQTKFRGTCQQKCQREFQRDYVIPQLLTDARIFLRELNQRKIDRLVVDITGNGGGSGWGETLSRMLSPRPTIPCPMAKLIKHPVSAEIYTNHIAEVDQALKTPGLSQLDTDLLRSAKGQLEELNRQVQEHCDLSAYWNSVTFKPQCSLLPAASEFACGQFPYLQPGALKPLSMSMRRTLFYSLGSEFEESLYRGRLFILIDRYSSSSSEYFSAMLQDANAALIIGERSNASGCGYVNGGVPLTLPHSGLNVMASNCIRFRKDGSNEVFGIKPDVEIPWAGEDAPAALKSLIEAVANSPTASSQ
jgi:C-terminal processing protease CtpA/Prc